MAGARPAGARVAPSAGAAEVARLRAGTDRLSEGLVGVDSVGDVLAAVVDLARRAGVDPEDALRRATAAAEVRYRVAEGRSGDPA